MLCRIYTNLNGSCVCLCLYRTPSYLLLSIQCVSLPLLTSAFKPVKYFLTACSKTPFEERVNTVLSWLDQPSGKRYHKFTFPIPIPVEWNGNKFVHHCSFVNEPCNCCYFRPQFLAMYFNQPDYAGHRDGPNSSQVAVVKHHILCVYHPTDHF